VEAVVVWVVVRAQPAVHARDLSAVVRAVVVMGGADAEVVRAAVVKAVVKAAVARVVVKVVVVRAVVVRAVVVRAVVGAQSAVYGRGLADAGPSAPEAPATHYARPGPLWRLSQTRAR
jgi:hypothetical protein